MKSLISCKFIFGFAIMAMLGISSSGQLIYVDSIYVQPANPTTNDSIIIITKSVFNEMCIESTTQIIFDNINNVFDLTLFQCYGVLQNICNKSDTFPVGLLPAGIYDVNFTVFTTGYNTQNGVCYTSYMQSAFDTYAFQVLDATGSKSINMHDNIKIYPNPASGQLYVEADNLFGVDVINIQGGLVLSQNINTKSQKCVLDLSSFPQGLYIIKATTGEGVFTERIVLD